MTDRIITAMEDVLIPLSPTGEIETLGRWEHTPGPWELADIGDYSDFDGNSRVVLGDDRRIAVVKVTPGSALFAESDANARLIAAAPDLLAALEAMVRDADRNQRPGGGSDVPDSARAAIAKAKGGAA